MKMSEQEKQEMTDWLIAREECVEEDSIYAHKFAVMQQQIDEKDAKIQELETKQKEMCEEYCPKTARIKELEEALLKVKDKNTTLFITCRNSIPKQKVKDFINKLKLSGGSNGKDNVENLVRELAIEILEELL